MKHFLLVTILTLLSSFADIPEEFNYQARILDDGNLANGNQTIIFRIYDALTGGNELFSETQIVNAIDGLISAQIGANSVSPRLCNVFQNNANVYLELVVNGETLSPRERLVSVPFAFNAKQLDGVGQDGYLRSDQDDTFANGTLTIDTTASLEVEGALDLSGNEIHFDGGTDKTIGWTSAFGGVLRAHRQRGSLGHHRSLWP